MLVLPEEYRLEDIGLAHHIDAALFVPFVIYRLGGDTSETQATLTVTLRDVVTAGESQRTLRLLWSPDSLPARNLGVQEHTITEWAALGVACIVVSVYAGLHVRAVTGLGDRFDYWVSDGKDDYGLEVSGTLGTEIEARHRAKVRQWRENPYGVDGYVVVVGFAERNVICSFHRFEESLV